MGGAVESPSDSMMPRPMSGCTPRNENVLGVTCETASASAPSRVGIIIAREETVPMMPSNTSLCSW